MDTNIYLHLLFLQLRDAAKTANIFYRCHDNVIVNLFGFDNHVVKVYIMTALI